MPPYTAPGRGFAASRRHPSPRSPALTLNSRLSTLMQAMSMPSPKDGLHQSEPAAVVEPQASALEERPVWPNDHDGREPAGSGMAAADRDPKKRTPFSQEPAQRSR